LLRATQMAAHVSGFFSGMSFIRCPPLRGARIKKADRWQPRETKNARYERAMGVDPKKKNLVSKRL